MYGRLDEYPEIAPYVRGKRCWDYGAGDLKPARALLRMGAAEVIAIDKSYPRGVRHEGKLTLRGEYFSDCPYPETTDIAFVSFPANNALPGLVKRLECANTCIYLGLNDGWTACGGPELWMHLLTRPQLMIRESPNQRLIVYGRSDGKIRLPHGLEEVQWLCDLASMPAE